MMEYDYLTNKDNWLEASDKGYEMNREVLQDFRDMTGSLWVKPIMAIDPLLLPTTMAAIEITEAVLWAGHKGQQWAINYFFDSYR